MPLLNSFVESFVCIGFSSERGVTLDPESKNNGSLFTSSLQPLVLSIVTADRAMYPQARGNDFIDPSYPTINRSSSHSHSFTTPPISSGRSTPISTLTTSLRTQKEHIIPDKYNNLPLFCCPDAVRATYQREKEKLHHLVFTQEEGKRSYALALTFQQGFTLKTNKPDDDGTYQIEDDKPSTSNSRRSSISKIPVPVEKQKPVSQPSPPLAPPAKGRSKKMPSSFHYSDTNSASKPQPPPPPSPTSNDTTKPKKNYATPTFSSYMKNLSSTATPPPTRMVRTNSQNNLSSSVDTTRSSTVVRPRSGSNLTRTLSVSSVPSSKPVQQPPPPPPTDPTKPFYLPHCIVLISTQPYWTSMQETISIIHDEITQSKVEPSSKEYKLLIQKYAFLACNTPVPPIPWERFSLSFNLTYEQSVLKFDPPINTNRAVLDLDLSGVLLTLNIGKLLEVLAAIFTQQPIIFFSSNYSKLVTTLECLLYLIYPLKWIHVYVPLVPDGLRDYYLEGPPGSYIMGANSRHELIVEELNISCTCNLDNDKNVRVPKTIPFHRIPSTKAHRFIDSITKLLEEIKVARSSQNVHTPVRLRIDQQRDFERQQRLETNQKILKVFFNLMVDLCGDALKPIYWKVYHQQTSPADTLTRTASNLDRKNSNQSHITSFSKEKYFLSKTEGDELEFYRAFVESTAFQLLMEEEMTSTAAPTLFRQICQIQLLSNEDQLYHIDNTSAENSPEIQIDSTATLCDSMSSQMLLSLPDWSSNTSTHYLDSCIEMFTDELQNAQQERSPGVIAVYAYLCGCALLARGQYLEGLRTLYLIENPDLFPHDYIETTIVPRLADECLLELFLHEPFYTKSPEWKQVRTRPTVEHMSIIDFENSGNSIDDAIPIKSKTDVVSNNEWNVVENALTYEQFSAHVHRLSIVLDKEITETLFNALIHWTDNTITKTLKKDKPVTNNVNKPAETNKPLARRWSTSTFTLKDTLTLLNDHRRGQPTTTVSLKPSVQVNPTLPAVLFESFLEIWQQTNVEKVRMIRCLPEDRRKQESILKVSTSGIVSKKDGPGQLILTQKRLYFLPETLPSARLLIELINIVLVEKYQHQTVFSSSKPGIKIYALSSSSSSSLPHDQTSTLKSKSSSLEKESKSTFSLLFKNNYEQELWSTIITELWAGLTIAHEQCDTVILNKASRHIALMDTLANISYYEEPKALTDKLSTSSRDKSKQRHDEACVEMALNDLSIFTRKRQNGSFKPLSVETRNVLTRRLAPSINETERHPVRCLVFTEHPDNGRSSLWCAYGSKLKVFNVSTWICDPSDILLPSLITCMCLDARSKLWVGCLQGELFVVDTITRICGAQLAKIDGEGGCQTIAFDPIRNHILTANRIGSVIQWNASNWERLNDINLLQIYQTTHDDQQRIYKSEAVVTLRNKFEPPIVEKNQSRKNTFYFGSNEALNQLDIPNITSPSGPAPVTPSSTDKLERIQIYEDLLFACYQDDYILILRISDSNTYTYEHLISVKYKTGESTPNDSFLIYNKQVWVSTGRIIYIFNASNTDNENSYNLLMKKPVDDDNLIVMLGFSGYIWAGSLSGNVYVYRMDNYELYKTFAGHHGSVCCLCSMLDMYVVSGSAQTDTSIAIWENVQATNNGAIGLTKKRSTTSTNGNSSPSRSPRKPDTNGEVVKPIDIL